MCETDPEYASNAERLSYCCDPCWSNSLTDLKLRKRGQEAVVAAWCILDLL